MKQLNFFPEVKSNCTVSQAMSCLVKSVRIRRVDDAAYWYLHIAKFFPLDNFRLFRRLLIISAEDCIDPETQRMAYEWYKVSLNSKDIELVHRLAIFLIQKICTKENWWQSKSGQKYIASWRVTESILKYSDTVGKGKDYYNSQEFLILFSSIIDSNDTMKCLELHMSARNSGFNVPKYADFLIQESIKHKNLQARLTAQTHSSYGKMLGNFDDNWVGQSLWRLLGNELKSVEISKVSDTDDLIERLSIELESSQRPAPSWGLDGIHCSGSDRRFAGLLYCMVACCNYFNRVGVLNPDAIFVDEDYSSKTLLEAGNGKV